MELKNEFTVGVPTEQAWALLSERVAVLCGYCAETAKTGGVADAVGQAVEAAAAVSARLAEHVPAELRPG